MADEAGNAILGGEYNLDLDLAAAARRTILTTERVVSRSEIEAQGADILAGWVDDVVATPRGAYPTSCFPLYDVDLEFLADYVEACRAGSFESFIGDRVLNGA
jgi:glutaconate CoA-transferase subunit A